MEESLIQISKKMSRLPLVARHDSDSRLFSQLLNSGLYKVSQVPRNSMDGAGHGGTEFPFFVDWGRWAEETVGFMLD